MKNQFKGFTLSDNVRVVVLSFITGSALTGLVYGSIYLIGISEVLALVFIVISFIQPVRP